jgi:mono/diheme cytochrome c family protein
MQRLSWKGLWFVSTSVALVLAGCTTSPPPDDDPVAATPVQIWAGHMLAEGHCGACHAVSVTDKSRMPQAPPFRTLSKRYPVSSLGEALAEGIVTGHPDMPEWVLTPDEITELLGYIQSIQSKH